MRPRLVIFDNYGCFTCLRAARPAAANAVRDSFRALASELSAFFSAESFSSPGLPAQKDNPQESGAAACLLKIS